MIPKSEVWLYKNSKALAAVRVGLAQAREGNVTKNPPNLKAAVKLVKQLEN